MENLDMLMDNLDVLITKLKVNRENLGEAVLRSAYAKPYQALKTKIARLTDKVVLTSITCGHAVSQEDSDSLVEAMEAVLPEILDSNEGKELGEIVFTYCDLDLLCLEILRLRVELDFRAYVLYWLAHTVPRDGTYWNDLIGASWHGQWISDDGHPVPGWPPTVEACILHRDAALADIEASMYQLTQCQIPANA